VQPAHPGWARLNFHGLNHNSRRSLDSIAKAAELAGWGTWHPSRMPKGYRRRMELRKGGAAAARGGAQSLKQGLLCWVFTAMAGQEQRQPLVWWLRSLAMAKSVPSSSSSRAAAPERQALEIFGDASGLAVPLGRLPLGNQNRDRDRQLVRRPGSSRCSHRPMAKRKLVVLEK